MNQIYTYKEVQEELSININKVNDLQEGIILNQLISDQIFYKKIQKVWIDFKNINELNSLSISELISLHNRFKKNNPNIEIHLINVKPQVYNLMQLVNVDVYFKVHIISNNT
jgi:anti-anti-sigma regulatory factor